MNHQDPNVCVQMEELISRLDLGELEGDLLEQVQHHLEGCATCREVQAQYARLSEATLPSHAPTWSPGRGDAIFDAIMHQLQPEPDNLQVQPRPEILTMDEVAQLLRVTHDDLAHEIHDLPVFEFAGQLRIRRSRLMEWIEAREKRAKHRRIVSHAE